MLAEPVTAHSTIIFLFLLSVSLSAAQCDLSEPFSADTVSMNGLTLSFENAHTMGKVDHCLTRCDCKVNMPMEIGGLWVLFELYRLIQSLQTRDTVKCCFQTCR